jgi:lipopolysaccharide transport system permease protein
MMHTSPQPTVVIEARPETTLARLKSLWRYRAFYGFLFKEIMMRKARGTLLGVWWLIIRPLVPAVTFIFAFTAIKPIGTPGDTPYPIFLLSGLMTWQLFQSGVTYLPRTMTWTQSIMRRTYFPRLLIPLAGFGPPLIEVGLLCVVFAVVVGMSWSGTGQWPLHLGWQTFWLLPAILGALLFALSIGMVMSIVALFFRDVRFIVGYFAQIFMFLTPVVYPVTFIPQQYHWLLYVLNPMAQMVEASRWALIGIGEFSVPFFCLSYGVILLFLVGGVTFFLRAEVFLGDQL